MQDNTVETLAATALTRLSSRGWAVALLVLTYLGNSMAWAASGRVEVVNATSRYTNDGWIVDARVDMELSDAAAAALQNGVTLRFEFQYEVTQYRRFWLDKVITVAEQDIELQYLSLSQRYLVRWLDTGEQASYATLFSALRYLGLIRGYALPPGLSGEPDPPYTFSMRAVLDPENLPGPLQVLTFWRGDFSLGSDWYRWQAN